jgi:stage II sporulation protein D
MINQEPLLSVGIYEHEAETRGILNGRFALPDKTVLSGEFSVRPDHGNLALIGKSGHELARGPEIRLVPEGKATFTLRDVTIGINIHWEGKEDQTFEGGLRLLPNADGTITAINDAGVEQYLKSVISSEMNTQAPLELLRAHAITSRSWLVAMLERQKQFKNVGGPARRGRETEAEILQQVLPTFDQETTDFYRWTVTYTQEELAALLSGLRLSRA